MSTLVEDYINQKCISCQRAGVKHTYIVNNSIPITEVIFRSSNLVSNYDATITHCYPHISYRLTGEKTFVEITNGHIYHCKLQKMFTKRLTQEDYK